MGWQAAAAHLVEARPGERPPVGEPPAQQVCLADGDRGGGGQPSGDDGVTASHRTDDPFQEHDYPSVTTDLLIWLYSNLPGRTWPGTKPSLDAATQTKISLQLSSIPTAGLASDYPPITAHCTLLTAGTERMD